MRGQGLSPILYLIDCELEVMSLMDLYASITELNWVLMLLIVFEHNNVHLIFHVVDQIHLMC